MNDLSREGRKGSEGRKHGKSRAKLPSETKPTQAMCILFCPSFASFARRSIRDFSVNALLPLVA